MRPSRPQPHTIAGAYAMDALDERDRARFERHLARCQECGQEIIGLREATARLAAAASRRPAAAVKARLLAETACTRQLPPVTTTADGHPARHGVTGPAGSRGRPDRRWLREPRLVPALALAGIFFIAIAAVWLTGNARESPLAREAPHSQAIAAVLTAPDATVISALVRTGGTATVVMSPRERMLVFAADGLRALPASRCYELWLLSRGSDRPAGLLPMPRHGMTGPVTAPGVEPGDRLGLTVEPVTGSRHPTSVMIMIITL